MSAEVKKNSRNGVPNPFELALVVILEALISATLFYLNYLLRYDPATRYRGDVTDQTTLTLSCRVAELDSQYRHTDPTSEGATRMEVPEWLFFTCLLAAPVLLIFSTEACKFIAADKRNWSKSASLYRIWRITGSYLLGLSITGTITSVLKFLITSPRPYFMSACYPHSDQPIVPEPCAQNRLVWQPFAECETASPEALLEALKSFPSYHASLAAFGGYFTSAWVCQLSWHRVAFSGQMLAVAGVLITSVGGAVRGLSTGLSFPEDLMAGALVGVVMAFITSWFVADAYRSSSKEQHFTDSGASDVPMPIKNHERARADEDAKVSAEYLRIADRIDSITFLPRVRSTYDRRQLAVKRRARDVDGNGPERPVRESGRGRRADSATAPPSWYSYRTSNRPFSIPTRRTPQKREMSFTNYGFSDYRHAPPFSATPATSLKRDLDQQNTAEMSTFI